MDKDSILKWVSENEWFLGPWEAEAIRIAVNGLKSHTSSGIITVGFVDGHLHWDRVFTYRSEFFQMGINLSEITDLPLAAKQDLIGFLHDGLAFSEESLYQRMRAQVERCIKIGTRQMWGVTDTTPDVGLRSFEIGLRLKREFAEQIDIKVGCYPLFGLTKPDRVILLEEAAKKSDFIVGLPEKDDDSDDKEKIGFKRHVSMLLDLGFRTKQEVHLHVDQKNSGLERGSIHAIECLEALTSEKFAWFTAPGRPKLWLVHVISPSCYPADQFSCLVNKLVKYNIGIVCCPVAAISMRQLRSEQGPIHNSIARLVEFLKVGIPVVFGTDNVNDFLIPSGNGLVIREIVEVSNYIRNYVLHILVKIGMGIPLNNGDRAILARSLYETQKAYENHKQWIGGEKEEKIRFNF